MRGRKASSYPSAHPVRYVFSHLTAGLLAYGYLLHPPSHDKAQWPGAKRRKDDSNPPTVAGAATVLVPFGSSAPCSLLIPSESSAGEPSSVCLRPASPSGQVLLLCYVISLHLADALRSVQPMTRTKHQPTSPSTDGLQNVMAYSPITWACATRSRAPVMAAIRMPGAAGPADENPEILCSNVGTKICPIGSWAHSRSLDRTSPGRLPARPPQPRFGGVPFFRLRLMRSGRPAAQFFDRFQGQCELTYGAGLRSAPEVANQRIAGKFIGFEAPCRSTICIGPQRSDHLMMGLHQI